MGCIEFPVLLGFPLVAISRRIPTCDARSRQSKMSYKLWRLFHVNLMPSSRLGTRAG